MDFMACPNDFELSPMGGGCEAYVRTYPNGCYTVLSDHGGTTPPQKGGQLHMVGTYDEEGDEIETTDCLDFRSLGWHTARHAEEYGDVSPEGDERCAECAKAVSLDQMFVRRGIPLCENCYYGRG